MGKNPKLGIVLPYPTLLSNHPYHSVFYPLCTWKVRGLGNLFPTGGGNRVWLGESGWEQDSPVGFSMAGLPLTCCSRVVITSTAMCKMLSLVCALSFLQWIIHIRPNSLNASFISRTRTLKGKTVNVIIIDNQRDSRCKVPECTLWNNEARKRLRVY